MPTLYLLAGPNGAGKTTASKTLLPDIFHCDHFLNADEIAAQLNPEKCRKSSIAGRKVVT